MKVDKKKKKKNFVFKYWAKKYNGPEYGLTIKHNGGSQTTKNQISIEQSVSSSFDFVVILSTASPGKRKNPNLLRSFL